MAKILAFILVMFVAMTAHAALSDTTGKAGKDDYFENYYKSHQKPDATISVPAGGKSEAFWIQDRLCIALLTFAFLLICAEVFLFIKGRIDQIQILKLIVITLVIFSLLFLITAGFDNAQTQTSVGLLGTIAGYMLGRSSAEGDARRSRSNTDQGTL